jgi:tRNA(Ile2) C34 agmatinyltransferase TiaS
VASFINNDIQNKFGSLQQVTSSMLRVDNAKDNISKANQIIALELKGKDAKILADNFVNKYAKDKCNGKNPIDCLHENKNDNQLNQFGAQSVLKEIKRIEQLEKFSAQLTHLKKMFRG